MDVEKTCSAVSIAEMCLVAALRDRTCMQGAAHAYMHAQVARSALNERHPNLGPASYLSQGVEKLDGARCGDSTRKREDHEKERTNREIEQGAPRVCTGQQGSSSRTLLGGGLLILSLLFFVSFRDN